jgi:acyl dehydratase
MRFFDHVPLNEPRESRELTIDEAEMVAFAKTWDPQPFHVDKELAEKTELGLIASGLLTVCIALRLSSGLSDEPLAVVAGLGWDEIRFHAPVRAGDRVHVRSRVISKRRSESRPGMGIMVSSIELLNQDGAVVLSLKNSALLRCA